MRWLICLAILTVAGDAAAELDFEFEVRSRPPVQQCPRAKTWDLVVKCLTKYGKPRITKQLQGVKLVTILTNNGTTDTGVLLYVQKGGEWQIGGRYEAHGAEYQLLGFEQVTVGKKSGYRLDIGQVSALTLMVDGISPIPAQLRLKRQLFCGGVSYYCQEAMSQCEVSVQGRTWYTFRGTLEYEEGAVNIRGDRTHAGPHCGHSTKVYLGWP